MSVGRSGKREKIMSMFDSKDLQTLPVYDKMPPMAAKIIKEVGSFLNLQL